MYCTLFNTIVLFAIIHQLIASEWNYGSEGPDVWSDTNPLCAGHSQSPISITTACTAYKNFSPFGFSKAYSEAQNFKIINTGHTISGTYTGSDSSIFTLTGGDLVGSYVFSSFHLHWGENYKSGSEHQINGEKYSGEVHFIHVDPTTGQTAVLGMFIQSKIQAITVESRKRKRDPSTTTTAIPTSTEWDKYLLAAEALQEVNESVVVSLNLASLFTGDLNTFWRYTGSLTTPPCTEGIIWTIFKQPIAANDNQLVLLRNNLYTKDYRGPQPLYSRLVYRSFPIEASSSIADYMCCWKKN
ncbi:unnamed protein product [Adineta steineri]|uniref:Carbonic anhydrase n=1 Tax=Adineta steineri TaxID=433720 RepID=A0A818TE79_9BILA|nr:unnamed protein product [Adineta steineri]